MKHKIKPCKIVGNAFMVVEISRFGIEKVKAIGLTKFEAHCLKKRLTS